MWFHAFKERQRGTAGTVTACLVSRCSTSEELARLTAEFRGAGIKIYKPQDNVGRAGCASFKPFAKAPNVKKSKGGAVVDGVMAGVPAKQHLHRGDTVEVVRVLLGKRQVCAVGVFAQNDCCLVRTNEPQAVTL